MNGALHDVIVVVCFAPGADYEYTFSKGGMSLTFRE